MQVHSSLQQFLRPSLGKIGLLGIVVCLALGANVPRADVELSQTNAVQTHQVQPTGQAKVAFRPGR